MTNTALTNTGHASRADEAREDILAQHHVIRNILQGMRGLTRNAIGGHGLGVIRLRGFVTRLCSLLEEHMAFEERLLVPLLFEMNEWGPERAQHLIEEHARQRQELATLAEMAAGESDRRAIAFAVQSLVSDIVADMAHEERVLLVAEVLGGHVDY